MMPKLKLKRVRYRVTGDFGSNSEGDIIYAYIIAREGMTAIVYHPPELFEGDPCGSIEICKLADDSKWINIEPGDDTYVNIDDPKQLKFWHLMTSLADARREVKKGRIL
jgi:hypothetical protein